MRVEGPRQAWVVDTTEWRVAEGKVFIYGVIDAHSRYGPRIAPSLFEDASATLGFYEEALRDEVPVAMHSDQGSELANRDCKTYLALRGVQWKPGPSHTPNAQAFIERFFRTIKEEWRDWKDPRTFHELEQSLARFQAWYSQEREHSSLDYAVPEHAHDA
ncbi:MAG: transposase [Methanobacteriota archaeon]